MVSSYQHSSAKSARAPPPRKRAGMKKFSPPLYKARVREDTTPLRTGANVNDDIVNRIKKCLARARHEKASEHEARTAMHMATRLMTQYNIHEADVDAHDSTTDGGNAHGHSIVAIVRCDKDYSKPVRQNIYVHRLGSAIDTGFKVRHFTLARSVSLDVTFYGLAMNTVAAANAFEMVYNLMLDWAQHYRGGNERNSYCMGICKRLQHSADEELETEEQKAKEFDQQAVGLASERVKVETQLARVLEQPSTEGIGQLFKTTDSVSGDLTNRDDKSMEPSHDYNKDHNRHNTEEASQKKWYDLNDTALGYDEQNDDYDEPDFHERDLDIILDVDELLQALESARPRASEASQSTTMPPTAQVVEPSQSLALQPYSHTQLMAYRGKAEIACEAYLRDHNIKLSRSRRCDIKLNTDAYGEGLEDGRGINVRQKLIKS